MPTRSRMIARRGAARLARWAGCWPGGQPLAARHARHARHARRLSAGAPEPMSEPATVPLVQLEDAVPEVRAVYEDIMVARGVPDVNNFVSLPPSSPPGVLVCWDAARSDSPRAAGCDIRRSGRP